MKTSIAAILALAGAATVAAVEFPPNVPGCGQTCGNNMMAKAGEFGCGNEDAACLCKHQDFGNGIRDCSLEHCQDVEKANQLINWAVTYCKDAGTPIAISPVGSVNGPGSGSGDAGNTGGAGATPTDGSGNEATAIATSTWTSIFTSSDVTVTATGTTTVSGVNGVPVGGAIGGGNNNEPETTVTKPETTVTEPETTVTAPVVSTHTGESTTFETTIGSTTLTGDDAQNTGGAGGQGGESGAHMTAAPAFGFIAAAGIAAAFL